MRKKGFTILEILAVLAVLAILIGIAVPRIKGMQDQANITKVKAELKTLQSAIETYYINQNPPAYPASSTTIIQSTLNGQTPQIVVDGTMYDPFGASTTTEYNYIKSTDGKYYVLGSVGTGSNLSTLAISTAGVVTKAAGNICRTNGSGC